MLNLKIGKRQASPADLPLSRQSARFDDLLRRTIFIGCPQKIFLKLTFYPQPPAVTQGSSQLPFHGEAPQMAPLRPGYVPSAFFAQPCPFA